MLTSEYVYMQLCNFFPDTRLDALVAINRVFDKAMKRMLFCISHIRNAYFKEFDHLNGDHYAMFLYYLSNTVESEDTAKRLYLLNKALHSIDVFYEVKLPDIFMFVHPVGTVLGRAKYSNYFKVYHNCSVGSNGNRYPTIGEYVTLHPGSMALGECRIGRYCRLAAKSLLIDRDIEDFMCYKGDPKNHTISYTGNVGEEVWC